MRNIKSQVAQGHKFIENHKGADLTATEMCQLADIFRAKVGTTNNISDGIYEVVVTAFLMGVAVGSRNVEKQSGIGTRLVELRGKRSQEEVAEGIGVSPNTYALYESGERIPRAEIKQRIADFYGCSINSIFYA